GTTLRPIKAVYGTIEALQETSRHYDDSTDKSQVGRKIATDSERLYILVESWAPEGIAGWRKALSELMLLAKAVNATIVEPSIQRGRPTSPGQGNFTLFDIFNQTLINDFYAKWISADEYYAMIHQKTNGVQYFDLCVGSKRHQKCGAPGQSKRNETELIHSTVLGNALQSLQVSDTENGIVTLRVFDLWKGEIKYMHSISDPSQMIFATEEFFFVMRNHLEFSPFMHSMADKALELMGIPAREEYAVIHWRGEKQNLDFMQCAGKIAEAKSAMLEQQDTSIPFVLMSSISSNIDNVWSPGQKHVNASAAEALQFLTQKHGFKKSDSILPQQKDMIVYVVVDLILAQRAVSFATCKRCRGDWCQVCNYGGSFGMFAMEMRKSAGNEGNTFECWPRIRNQTLVQEP
ncbi:MAG: hypothetical protein SGILL_008637, partial [Bacillariaceae sp.]